MRILLFILFLLYTFPSFSSYGISLFEKGEYKKAYSAISKELLNNNKDYALLNMMGACCYNLGKTREAEKYYLLSLKNKPDYIYALANLAILYLENNEYSSLNIICHKLIKYFPERFYGYLGRAYYLYKKKKYDEAYSQVKIAGEKMYNNDKLLNKEENRYFYMLYLDLKKKIIASK